MTVAKKYEIIIPLPRNGKKGYYSPMPQLHSMFDIRNPIIGDYVMLEEALTAEISGEIVTLFKTYSPEVYEYQKLMGLAEGQPVMFTLRETSEGSLAQAKADNKWCVQSVTPPKDIVAGRMVGLVLFLVNGDKATSRWFQVEPEVPADIIFFFVKNAIAHFNFHKVMVEGDTND